MFHHFHGSGHPVSQGSMSAADLHEMLDWLDRYRILDAHEWITKAVRGRLRDDDIVLTFDDNLRCQHDVALPILRERSLTACWFVYSSVLEGTIERLELYRDFRCSSFDDIDDFYDAFVSRVEQSPYGEAAVRALESFDTAHYLVGYPFYTDRDRVFRFLRDDVLGDRNYRAVMDGMLDEWGVDRESRAARLWMDARSLGQMAAEGHVVGLHSHTHPTVIAALPAREQRRQYERNFESVRAATGEAPMTMSHPSNSYGPDTLDILRSLGIELGFRADMCGPAASPLEHPRQDHANVLAEMRGAS